MRFQQSIESMQTRLAERAALGTVAGMRRLAHLSQDPFGYPS
jgi:hypothetical protein